MSKRYGVGCLVSVSAFWLVFCGAGGAAPIHDLAEAGDVAGVRADLAAHPEDVTLLTQGGAAPLHLAAGVGSVEMVEALLAAGANLEATTPQGWTPLHWAAHMDAEPVTRLLLAKGADPLARTLDGQSVLRVGVKKGASKAVGALLMNSGVAYADPFLDIRSPEGAAAAQDGDLVRARALFESLASGDPQVPQYHFAAGLAAYSMGDLPAAEKAFEQVVRLNPGNGRAYAELGQVALGRREPEVAQRHFEKALSLTESPQVRAQIEGLMTQAISGQKRWTWSGRVDGGYLMDDNVNVGPDAPSVSISPITYGSLVLDTLEISEASQPTESPGWFGALLLSSAYDPGQPGYHVWGSDVLLYRNWLTDAPDFETGYAQLSTGPRHVGTVGILEVPVRVALIETGGDPLVTLAGIAPSYLRAAGERADWQWIVNGIVESRNYDTLNARDSVYMEGGGSIRRLIGEKQHTLSLGVSLFSDRADAAIYQQTGRSWNLAGEYRLPWRSYLYARLRRLATDYKAQEPLAPMKREDTQEQLTLGMLQRLGKRVEVDFNYQVTDNGSTFALYQYERHMTTISTSYSF